MNVSDFYPYFIDPFERHLESFLIQKIVNNLTYVHKTYNFMQAIVSKSEFPQSDLLSSHLNLFQSLMETHQYFYNPIEIQMEMTFQGKVIVNTFLLVHMFAISVHNIFKFIYVRLIVIVFLLPIFVLYIHSRNKILKCLHWKYDYT